MNKADIKPALFLFWSKKRLILRFPIGTLIPAGFPVRQVTAGDLRIVPDHQYVFTVISGGRLAVIEAACFDILSIHNNISVSYTHLDVYKRQQLGEVKKVIVTSLPDGHLESTIYFSTGNTPVEIDIQTSHKLIGDLTTEANKFYVISVVNRYVIMGEAIGIDG